MTTTTLFTTSRRQEQWLACWVVLLCFANHGLLVDGFATYLLNNVGCMTELSTDEVIMNQNVIAAVDSDHPLVHLEVVVDNTGIVSTVKQPDGRYIYHFTATNSQDDGTLLQVRLNLEAHRDLYDVQFVVDMTDAARQGVAHFVKGQCDHQSRVAGRGSETVDLVLTATATSCVSLVAGWATGHEAVRLTPVLGLCPTNSEQQQPPPDEDQPQEQEEQEPDDPAKEIEIVNKESNDAVPASNDKDKKKEHVHTPVKKKIHRSNSDRVREGHRRHPRKSLESPKQQQLDNKKPPNDNINKEEEEVKNSEQQRRRGLADKFAKVKHHLQKHHEKMKEHTLQQIKEHANNKNKKPSNNYSGEIQLDTKWFLYGLGILLLGTITVIQLCRSAASSRGDPSMNGGKPQRLHSH